MTTYAVQLHQLEAVPLAVIRRHVSRSELAHVVPECCGLVWSAVKAQQARGGRHVAVYLDDTIRLEVGAEILGPFSERDDVVLSATPAGTVASTTHFGPYTGLGAAHEAIRRWCETNERALAGPNWEIYGHWLPEWNNDPSQIRTDVYYLLQDGP
jgi:effector-binding domain-containing protein